MIKNIAATVLAMSLCYLGVGFVMWDNPFSTIAEWTPLSRYGYLNLNVLVVSVSLGLVNLLKE